MLIFFGFVLFFFVFVFIFPFLISFSKFKFKKYIGYGIPIFLILVSYFLGGKRFNCINNMNMSEMCLRGEYYLIMSAIIFTMEYFVGSYLNKTSSKTVKSVFVWIFISLIAFVIFNIGLIKISNLYPFFNWWSG